MDACHILVVDDDAAVREMLGVFLTDAGYLVTTATNGGEALDTIELEPPDLVILDLAMPFVDGWTLTQYLRQHNNPIPILAVSGTCDIPSGEWPVGTDGFLAKPIAVGDLLAAVVSSVAASGKASSTAR